MKKEQNITKMNIRKLAVKALALMVLVCFAAPMAVFAENEDEALKPEMNNEKVALLQTRLMELGFMDEDEPTSYYGPMTQNGIELFQRKNNLQIDGIAGKEVLNLVYSDEAKPYSVSNGISGTDVEELQKRLSNLGYMSSVTGYFGDETQSAVERFQERNEIEVDGTIGRQTREKLYSSDVKANAFAAGEKGDNIKELQSRLKSLGYVSQADGTFGDETDAAVRHFQERNGLIADGYIGQETRKLLVSDEALPNALTLGANGADVEKIQKRLSSLGYMNDVTGYYGEATQDAVQAFQKKNDLSQDGTVGVETMSAVFSSDAVENGEEANEEESVEAMAPAKPQKSSSSSKSKKNNASSKSDKKKKNESKKDESKKEESSSSSASTGGGKGVEKFISVAKSKLGHKYVLGAKGPDKFDCSGFVYWCLNQSGVKTGYMTSGGWKNCGKFEKISKMSDVKRGDVLVFNGHVGISTGSGSMIDASSSNGKVVARGASSSYWKKNFICAYRVF